MVQCVPRGGKYSQSLPRPRGNPLISIIHLELRVTDLSACLPPQTRTSPCPTAACFTTPPASCLRRCFKASQQTRLPRQPAAHLPRSAFLNENNWLDTCTRGLAEEHTCHGAARLPSLLVCLITRTHPNPHLILFTRI